MSSLTMRRLSTALAAAFVLAVIPSTSSAVVVARVAHTTTLLPSGDVLVAGGADDTGATLLTADIFQATKGQIVNAATSMTVRRASHTATLLPGGCVMVAGGNNAVNDTASSPTNSIEIYNPVTNTWANPGTLTTARYNHTATLLNTGSVLICGGQSGAGTAIASCELYTPSAAPNECLTGAISAPGSLLQARYNHTAVLLKSGRVWFAGGLNPAVGNGYLPTTERYDPGTGFFQSASPLIEARAQHTATLMGDGKALVVGGYNVRDILESKGILESAEIYDPLSNSVTPAAKLSERRMAHSSVLDANGTVTLFGGLGNITTTYVPVSEINQTDMLLKSPSTVDLAAGVVQPTSSALLDLDFLLSVPVFGQIVSGEAWISSPAIHTDWGALYFTPASQTVPTTGLRVNLAGASSGCRPPAQGGECGNILVPGATLSQMQGSSYFEPKIDVVLEGDATGSVTFATTVSSLNVTETLTGGNLTMTATIGLSRNLVGYTLDFGTLQIFAGTVIQSSSYTITLTGGSANLPPTVINADSNGDGTVTMAIPFTGLTGEIEMTATSTSAAFNSPLAVPDPSDSAAMAVTEDRMIYRTNGANLAGETFEMDVATVVVRKMIFADAEKYNPKSNAWSLEIPGGAAVSDQRFGHTALLLPNNDTLVYGGRACNGAACATQIANTPSPYFQLVYAEKNFAATAGSAAQARAFHSATMLPGGDILVAGGTSGPNILNSAEIFTPATESFATTNGKMKEVRDLHTATLLPNGRVLIAGGFTTNAVSTGSTKTAEIYYPNTKIFLETTSMYNSRSNHGAISLPDGRVFVAGGFGDNDQITGTSEIYISTHSRWDQGPTMAGGCERAIHATVQLKDGRIMLIGGINGSGILNTSTIYNPTTNLFDNCAAVAAMPAALRSHTATLLFDGRVLVAGGNDGFGESNSSYIYDPVLDAWTTTHATPLLYPRFNHTATLLPNGNVMISGGSQRFGQIPPDLEVYHINASSWVTEGVTFAGGARAFHTMTLGLDNKIYAIGGSDGVIGGGGESLYTSAEAGYFSATPDSVSKGAPPSARISSITTTSATPFLPGTNLTVTGLRFRGGTEASGGGAASANSSFSFPHLILQQVEGSGGTGSQSNGGFAVDLTTEIFVGAGNLATLDTSLTVALPATSAKLPYGWYTLRTGANDIYSEAKMVQAGPALPTGGPANITGTPAGISSMTWSWDNSAAGHDGYNVYNATTGVFISSVAAMSPRTTFYQTSLGYSATSSILIAAYSLSGDGALSASPTSYTLSTTPVNVTIASVTFSDLLLHWGTNGNSATGAIYEVTQSSEDCSVFCSNVSTPMPRLFGLTTDHLVITNLAANTTYFFRVQAFNLAGTPSGYSLSVSTRTRAPVTQPTVSDLTTTSIDWGWADPGGVSSYNIYNATSGVLIGTSIGNSYTQVNLSTNSLHSIQVSAITNAGEGPLSPSASAYTSAATPGPAIPTISGLTTGSFTLNWTNNANPAETTYSQEFEEYDVHGTSISATNADTPSLVFASSIGGLKPSTLYGYSVVAVNGDGLPSDEPAVVTGSTYTLPAAPAVLVITGRSPTAISVAWEPNNNSSSATYQVTYSSNNFINISTAVFFSENFGGTSATVSSLVTGATYSIRVAASNPYGQRSQFSNVVSTRTDNGGAPIGSLQGPLLATANSTLSGSIGNGRQVLIRAAAQTFPSDVVVTLSSHVPAGTECPGATGIAFSIFATPALQPIGSLYFSFDFTAPELGTIPASRALLLRYDPASNTCIPLETTVDSASGWMTARINHFSLFIVGQVPLSTTAETARVFPNPFYTSRDGYITIDNVPPSARVQIFTLRGERVLDVKANASGILTWSGNNGSGRAVASGVYLVMIESGGTKKILKLAVIR